MSTVQLPAIRPQNYVRLTDAWFPLNYHEQQSRLWREKSRNVLVVAGRGSGKTEIARRRVVRHLRIKKPWHDPRYFYAMPTYKQCRDRIRDKVLALIPRTWLVKVPGDSAMEFKTVFGSWLFLVGLDVPARIEGDQYDGGVQDESSDTKPGVYGRSIRPALTHREGWLWRIGVPKRYGCGAHEFRAAFKHGLSGEGGMASYQWSSDTVLKSEELAQARQDTDAKDYEEQYGGNFVDAGGGAFYSFDDNLDVAEVRYRPDQMVIVGCDFNVTPMAWVLCHIVTYYGVEHLEVFDEIWLKDTNTKATLDVLWAKYGKQQKGGWVFCGDATGNSRKTSATEADYIIIRNDKRFAAQIRVPKANPPIRDRFAACNAMLCSAAGVRRCLIGTRCQHLRDDLDARTLKPSGEPDDSDPMAGHVTDAWGYVVWRFFPMSLLDFDTGQQTISVTGE